MARPRKAEQLELPTGGACEERVVHLDAVRDARAVQPAAPVLADLSSLFSALADVTRLRITAALVDRELCVCDIAATVGTSESAVSHHLRSMRGLGLVRSRKQGRLVYYALDDDHVATLFRQGLDHVAHRSGEVTS